MVKMILVDNDIRKYKNIIVPFDEESLQSESYDLHIGEKIYVLKNDIQTIDLRDNDILKNLYEEKKLSDFGYNIGPNEFILASLKEKVDIPEGVSAHIMPRTRYIRAGVYVSAQHINSTYSGRLRIGIYNLQNRPLRIYPDLGICQIVFEKLNELPSDNKLYKNKIDAIYHNEDIKFIGPFSDEEDDKIDKIVEKIKDGN